MELTEQYNSPSLFAKDLWESWQQKAEKTENKKNQFHLSSRKAILAQFVEQDCYYGTNTNTLVRQLTDE